MNARTLARLTLAELRKKMSRSEAASIAGKASAAKRRAAAGAGAKDDGRRAPNGEKMSDVEARANRLVAQGVGQDKAKGKKGAGAGKKTDPKAAAAKEQREKEHAADREQRAKDREQRQKEHDEDRAQRAADRESRAKEKEAKEADAKAKAADKAKAAQEKAKTKGGGSKGKGADDAKAKAQAAKDRAAEADKTKAERAAQQAAKDKERQAKDAEAKAAKDKAAQEKQVQETRLDTAAAHRAQAAIAGGGNPSAADTTRLIAAGLAEQNGAELRLTPAGKALLAPPAEPQKGIGPKQGGKDTGQPTTKIAKRRTRVPPSAFVFPESRAFPIQNAEDVPAAVQAWSRYTGPRSRASFQRNLTRIALRKGFALPAGWVDGPTHRSTALLQKRAHGPAPAWGGFATITKIDAEQHLVYGVASSEAPDDQPGIWKGERYEGDIIASEAMRKAAPDYLQWANIREMHQPVAAGTCVHFEVVGPNTEIGAHIVDDQAWEKVVTGVYKGFSIGGRALDAEIVKIDGRPYRRITALKLSEISLVDRPANPSARITLFKGDTMSDTDTETAALAADALAKAADPAKAIALIQQLRNEAELKNDLDAADAFTDAIRSIQLGSGAKPSDEDEDEDADLADDAAATDELAAAEDDDAAADDELTMAEAIGELRKAFPNRSLTGLVELVRQAARQSSGAAVAKRGAALSAANLGHAQTAHDAIHKMTGGAVCKGGDAMGDDSRATGAGAHAAPLLMAESLAPGDLAKAFSDALKPTLDGIAKGLEAQGIKVADLVTRLERVERQPAPGAPAARDLRAVEKTVPGGDLGGQQAAAVDSATAELDALKKVRDAATDDVTRKAISDEITKRELKNIYRAR